MKNQVMNLAHQLFRRTNFISNWSYALTLAWKIARISTIKVTNNLIEFKSKLIYKMKLFTKVTKEKGTISINDNHTFNCFVYELKGNI